MANAKQTPQQDQVQISAMAPDSSANRFTVSAPTGYLISIAMTAAATVVAVSIDSGVAIPNISLFFVLPVIVAGVSFGLGPSLCSAVVGALAYNFFLTEPRYTLMVDDPANIWAIALLLLVGFVVSGIAYTARRQAKEAARLRGQVSVLQGFSRDVMAANDADAIVKVTANALASLFQVPAVAMLVADGKVASITQDGDKALNEVEMAAALSSLAAGAVSRAEVYPAIASRYDFWPILTADGHDAVLGLAFDPEERRSAHDELVEIVSGILFLALCRQHLSAMKA